MAFIAPMVAVFEIAGKFSNFSALIIFGIIHIIISLIIRFSIKAWINRLLSTIIVLIAALVEFLTIEFSE